MNKKNILYLLLVTVFVGCGSPSSFKPNTIKPTGTNLAPTAIAQSVILDQNSTKSIALFGIDPNGDAVTPVVITEPTYGTYTNGIYRPTTNYHGSDSFNFTVNDGVLTSAPATINITINAKPSTTTLTPTPITQTPPTTQTTCNPPHKTGQTIVYNNNDDGDLQKGLTRSYTRYDANHIVIDNITGLMWQDNEVVQKPWVTQSNFDSGNYNDTSGDTAMSYCKNLVFGSYSDWRLPSIDELYYLRDLGRENPAIDPAFLSMSYGYWSSTSVAGSTKDAWAVLFYYGDNYRNKKNISYSVRCVRGEEKI